MNMKNTQNLLALALFVAATGCSDDKASNAPDAAVSDASQTATTVSLSTTGHLVDKDGKTLYFYVNDVASGNPQLSKCAVGTCLTKWPAFDAQSPTVGTGLTATDFGRFDRGDGTGFQATWKGRPLYYYSLDASVGATTGDGVGGIWFVARAYNLFFAADTTVTPQGGTAAGTPFLTNGAGRSVYVFKSDTRATGGGDPVSKCRPDDASQAACVAAWTIWDKPATVTTPVFPSTITATDVTFFTNSGKTQFVYKGWPLYFFNADANAGQVAGAMRPNWYAVNPAFSGTLP